MIVDSGSLYLLSLQASALATATWRLLVGNVSISETTVWASLTEAAWAGYAPVTVGDWGLPSLVSPRASMMPVSLPAFGNTSGADQTFNGWALLASDGVTLIAADALPGIILPNGGTRYLSPALTDTDETLVPLP